MALNIKTFVFNPFGENTYVAWDSETLHAIIIDPGMTDEYEETELADYITDNHLTVDRLINTHLHLDHTFGNSYVKSAYGVQLEAHAADAPLGASMPQQGARFGLRIPLPPVIADKNLNDGDTFTVGNETFTIFHVPGHSPGSIVLYDANAGALFSGDVLFRGSIGRTDLEGGNHAQLIHGIRTKLLPLPPDTTVYPGHGPTTTIGYEQRANPYL